MLAGWVGGPAGDTQELAYEVARLQSSLHNITASDAAAAAAVPASDDRDRGRLLRLLLEWRQQRKAALQKDIARLQQRLAEGGAQRLQQQQVSAQDKLLGWIEENGGQVRCQPARFLVAWGRVTGWGHLCAAQVWVLGPAWCNPPPQAVRCTGLLLVWTQVCGVRIGSTTGTTHGSGATANQGVFATRPTRPGQLLAVVPLSLALPINTENAMVSVDCAASSWDCVLAVNVFPCNHQLQAALSGAHKWGEVGPFVSEC